MSGLCDQRHVVLFVRVVSDRDFGFSRRFFFWCVGSGAWWGSGYFEGSVVVRSKNAFRSVRLGIKSDHASIDFNKITASRPLAGVS